MRLASRRSAQFSADRVFGGKSGVMNFLANKGVGNLERYVGKWLRIMGSDLRLVLTVGEGGEGVGRMVGVGGKYYGLGNLSGGQYRRLEIALILAVREMVSEFRVRR